MNAPDAVRWLAYARSDLNAARALLRDPDYYPRQVCFLSQQAAEKALKAVFVLLDVVEGDARHALQTAEAVYQAIEQDIK